MKPTDAFPEEMEGADEAQEAGDDAEGAAPAPRAKKGKKASYQTIFSISLIVCLLGAFGFLCYTKYQDRIDKGLEAAKEKLIVAKDKVVAQAKKLKSAIQKKTAKGEDGAEPAEATSDETPMEESTAAKKTETDEIGVAKLTDDPVEEAPKEEPETKKIADADNPFGADEPAQTKEPKEEVAASTPAEMPGEEPMKDELAEPQKPAKIKAERASVAQLKSPIPVEDIATLEKPQTEDVVDIPKRGGEAPAKLKEVVEEDPAYSRNRLAAAAPPKDPEALDDFPKPTKKPHADISESQPESRPTQVLTDESEEFGRYRPVESGSSETSSRTRIHSSANDNPPPAKPMAEEPPPVAKKELSEEFNPEPVARRIERVQPSLKKKSHQPQQEFVDNAPPAAAAAAPQADGQVYVVKVHDNYWKISKQQYGTARYFSALAKFNQEKVPDPQMMRPGTKIVVPAKEVLEQQFPELFREQKLKAEQEQKESGPQFFRDAKGTPKYRISSQDSLSTISERYLGKSSRWDEIYQLNQELLKDANSLKVGTVLDLPTDASQQRMAKEPQDFR